MIHLLTLASALLVAVESRPSGAPNEACISQMPGHNQAAQPPATNPYTVSLDGDTYYKYGNAKTSESINSKIYTAINV